MWRRIAVGALVVALALVLLIGAGLAGVALGESYQVFAREVADLTGVPSYTGFLAHITWFLWVAAGTVGLLAAIVLAGRGHRDRRIRFFLGTSLLIAVLLLLDDFAMLRERQFRDLGIPEEALFLLYAIILGVLLLRFRRQFVGGGVLLVVAAGAFWAVSIAVDSVQGQWGIDKSALEDGAKLIGTALWAALMVWSSLAALGGEPCDSAVDRVAAGGLDSRGGVGTQEWPPPSRSRLSGEISFIAQHE